MAYEDDHFINKYASVWNYSLFEGEDVHRFQVGELHNAYEKLGSHLITVDGQPGVYFAVWAPSAIKVSVVGDFNGWKTELHRLLPRQDRSGIWEGFIPNLGEYSLYKYFITGADGNSYYKADPYAQQSELRPKTASIVRNIKKEWGDDEWMNNRSKQNSITSPWSVYEVHLGSFMKPEKYNEESFNSYHQLIDHLVPYVKKMGFTHVEFMPVMEYPFDGSWGYQGTGYFAATSRFGQPEHLMDLIDVLHQNNIGVILDWVPSHFPADAHGLYKFDGSHVYEYADMRKGYHPDWNSYIFNYSRQEVISFLISSANYWIKEFHADGLRVDAVNSIMRLDFSRNEGEWEPNIHGGNGNLEAMSFIRRMNLSLDYHFGRNVLTIAEESSDWPKITHPVWADGYGFGMKWMMGWMHDMFKYFKKVPRKRWQSQDDLTFSMMYFYNENFMLPLSHDEVVHGKSPMIYKMPGNEWEKFANLRLLYSFMWMHPGGKLLFMGNEFGQTTEWNYKHELQWELLEHHPHSGVQSCIIDLNEMLKKLPALHTLQFKTEGFEWLDLEHRRDGIIVFSRKAEKVADTLVIVMNVSNIGHNHWPVRTQGYKIKEEIFSSDNKKYWGSGLFENPTPQTKLYNKPHKYYETKLEIPPLSLMVFNVTVPATKTRKAIATTETVSSEGATTAKDVTIKVTGTKSRVGAKRSTKNPEA